MQTQAQLEMVKQEFARKKEEARKANRTVAEVLSETGVATLDFAKNVMASFDLSALGRQGWLTALSDFDVWAKSVLPTIKSLSRQQSAKSWQQLTERENYRNGIYKLAKLAINTGDGTGNFANAEELYQLNLAGRIPGVGASDRAYATGLNEIRVRLFDKLLSNMDDPTTATKEQLQDLAKFVNTWTRTRRHWNARENSSSGTLGTSLH